MWLFLQTFLLTLIIMGYLISLLVVRLLPKRPGESSPLMVDNDLRKCG